MALGSIWAAALLYPTEMKRWIFRQNCNKFNYEDRSYTICRN
jgi:hypothetical protein